MSDSKVFMFPEGGGSNSNLMSMLAPLLNQKGLDPNLLLTMNKGGMFGEGGSMFIWIIFLFFLMGWNRNGMGFGGNGAALVGADLGNLINNNNGRDLLMAAVQGNADAIRQLSSTLNCDMETVKNSINNVMSTVQNVGNLIGMSSMQVINAIQAGNTSIGQQISQCCCDNRLAICNQTNTLLSSIEASARETQHSTDSGFKQILAKLDSMQTQSLQDKIDALREEKTKLSTLIGLEHQNAYNAGLVQQAVNPIAGQIASLSLEVASIKCKLPTTTTVTYSPVTAVPNSVLYGGCLDRAGNNFWY